MISSPPPPPKTKTRDQCIQTVDDLLYFEQAKLTLFLSVTANQEASTQVEHEPEKSTTPLESSFSSSNETLKFGYKTIEKDGTLHDLTSTSPGLFQVLLDLLYDYKPVSKSKEDFLLAFLMQLRLGLCFTSLAAIFSSNRHTISRNFHRILSLLYHRYSFIGVIYFIRKII